MAEISEYSGGIKVSVTGAGKETGFTKNVIASDIRRSTERWSKFSRINHLNIKIGRIDKGGRVEYTVKAEATGEGSFHADADEWSLEKAVQEALARLEKELLKRKQKAKEGRMHKLMHRRSKTGL